MIVSCLRSRTCCIFRVLVEYILHDCYPELVHSLTVMHSQLYNIELLYLQRALSNKETAKPLTMVPKKSTQRVERCKYYGLSYG